MNTTQTPHDFRGFRRTMHAVGPELRDQLRAALEDAGVTRQQWRILAALERGPATAAELDEAAKRRHRGHHRPADVPDAPLGAEAPADQTVADETRDEHGRPGHPFGGRGGGRFGRRGFGPGFGPFGRGFGPDFGPGFGPHADRHGRRRPTAEVLGGLAERGWVSLNGTDPSGETWTITETGAAELARISEKVSAVTAGLREGISDDDWATAMSVLQRVAKNTRR